MLRLRAAGGGSITPARNGKGGWASPIYSAASTPTRSSSSPARSPTASPLAIRYSATLDNPRNKRFVAAFKARGSEEPDQYAQAGYDSIFLLAEAIKRAGSTNPAKVREALARSDYVSVTGSPIRFDERNQATPKLYVAVIKDGRRVIAEDINTTDVPY